MMQEWNIYVLFGLRKRTNSGQGSVLVQDFWTPPPPIDFVHDQISIYLALFRVRLRHFLGRALRLGWAQVQELLIKKRGGGDNLPPGNYQENSISLTLSLQFLTQWRIQYFRYINLIVNPQKWTTLVLTLYPMKQVMWTGLLGSSLGNALTRPRKVFDLFLGRNPLDPWRGASNLRCDILLKLWTLWRIFTKIERYFTLFKIH